MSNPCGLAQLGALPDGIVFMNEKNRGEGGAESSREVSIARNITNAPGNEVHPWFSRDGKAIVFESDRSGAMEIGKLTLETLKATQLTFGVKEWNSNRQRM